MESKSLLTSLYVREEYKESPSESLKVSFLKYYYDVIYWWL